MGFDMEMDDFYDSKEYEEKNKSYFLFQKSNIISCFGIPFRKLVWNYICWFLAGKPKMKEQEIK